MLTTVKAKVKVTTAVTQKESFRRSMRSVFLAIIDAMIINAYSLHTDVFIFELFWQDVIV